MQIDVQFDGGELLRRFEERGKTAQVWLDSEILRSTEPFVPMDQGDLIGSGMRGTVPGSGLIVYKQPVCALSLRRAGARGARAEEADEPEDELFPAASGGPGARQRLV